MSENFGSLSVVQKERRKKKARSAPPRPETEDLLPATSMEKDEKGQVQNGTFPYVDLEKADINKALGKSLYEYICDDDLPVYLNDGSIGSQAADFGDTGLDWNKHFQQQLDALKLATHMKRGQPGAKQAKASAISQLAKLGDDFVRAAELYAKVIISEVMLPPHLKTVQPLSSGNLGQAGGEKYIARGILLKLAIDDKGIYGGSDEAAAKVAGHELRSLCQIYHYSVDGLYFPIMARIDYLGFRVLASSILPISSKTLKYGSQDGFHVYSADEKLSALIAETCGKRLNLKAHSVKGLLLYSPTDLEGHLGADGRYYVIDLSRLCPPTAPNAYGTAAGPNSYLYQLFRPEFVRTYCVPLCSDAYSKFGGKEHNKREHNPEIDDATKHLMEVTIPDLARQINDAVSTAPQLPRHILWPSMTLCPLASSLLTPFSHVHCAYWALFVAFCILPRLLFPPQRGTLHRDETSVTRLLHGNGINMRFCGLLWNMLDTKKEGLVRAWRSWLAVEMLARISKRDINKSLRSFRKESRHIGEEPYKQVVADHLTALFCSPDWQRLCNALQDRFYCEKITAETLRHLLCGCTLETPSWWKAEGPIGVSLLPESSAPFCFFFLRVEELLGLQWTPLLRHYRLAAFVKGDPMPHLPFLSDELASFRARAKHLSIVQYAKSVCYRKLVHDANIESPQVVAKILGQALLELDSVLDSVPQYAWALRCRAEVLEDMGLLARAEASYELAARYGRGPSSFVKFALFLLKNGNYEKAVEMCCKGLLKDLTDSRGRTVLASCMCHLNSDNTEQQGKAEALVQAHLYDKVDKEVVENLKADILKRKKACKAKGGPEAVRRQSALISSSSNTNLLSLIVDAYRKPPEIKEAESDG